jgi:hypothetical protein
MSAPSSTGDGWRPDFFIVGPQKCATTWMYEGLREHPEVVLPETDSVHYFDINYHKGEEWYRDQFPDTAAEYIVGDETPSYIRSPSTPARLAELNPDAKLIFSLRNPVDRAFSHYWHEKAKGKMSFEFEEVFDNYDLFDNWVVPGFYNHHIERFEQHFDEDQIKLMVFDDLVDDDRAFIRDVYEFVGADPEFQPSILDERVNEARPSTGVETVDQAYYGAVNFVYRNAGETVKSALRPIYSFVQETLIPSVQSESEYDEGMTEDTRRQLEEVFLEDVKRLGERTDRSFDGWFEHLDYDD